MEPNFLHLSLFIDRVRQCPPSKGRRESLSVTLLKEHFIPQKYYSSGFFFLQVSFEPSPRRDQKNTGQPIDCLPRRGATQGESRILCDIVMGVLEVVERERQRHDPRLQLLHVKNPPFPFEMDVRHSSYYYVSPTWNPYNRRSFLISYPGRSPTTSRKSLRRTFSVLLSIPP